MLKLTSDVASRFVIFKALPLNVEHFLNLELRGSFGRDRTVGREPISSVIALSASFSPLELSHFQTESMDLLLVPLSLFLLLV